MNGQAAIDFVNRISSTYLPLLCWDDLGFPQGGDGYRGIHVGGKPAYLHRVFYEHFKGPIADGLEIDHLCRNRACCNPGHLEAVSHIVNSRRRGHSPGGRRNGRHIGSNRLLESCPQGHSYSGDNLYVYPNGTRRCKTCSREALRRFRCKPKAVVHA